MPILWQANDMTQRTGKGEILTEIILETFRLNGVLLDAGNQLTKPHGLTSARWQVMGAIDHEGHPMTVAQIARRMGLSRQAVQRIVHDLVKLEMIDLEANQDHKRAPLVVLTERGRKTIGKINISQANWVNELAKQVSESDLKKTLLAMQQIRRDADAD